MVRIYHALPSSRSSLQRHQHRLPIDSIHATTNTKRLTTNPRVKKNQNSVGRRITVEVGLAVAESYSVDDDATLTVAASGVLLNDADVDGDPLSAVWVSGPGNGTLTLNADGSFTYTPNGGFSGTDSFTYLASDGTQNSNLATVTITVNNVIVPPFVPPPPPNDDPPPPSNDPPVDNEPPPSSAADPPSGDSAGTTATSEGANILVGPRDSDDGNTTSSTRATFIQPPQLVIGGLGSTIVGEFDSVMYAARESFETIVQSALPAGLVDALVDLNTYFDANVLWEKLDTLQHDLGEGSQQMQWTFGTAAAASLVLSAGYAVWTIHGGYLAASLLSSLPA